MDIIGRIVVDILLEVRLVGHDMVRLERDVGLIFVGTKTERDGRWGFTDKELKTPLRDYIGKEFEADPEVSGIDEEEWIDPLTGKPSNTQTGVGLTDITQDATGGSNTTVTASQRREYRVSRISNLVEEFQKPKAYNEPPESFDGFDQQDEQVDWSYLPGFHTAYWGNVGWLCPDGFEIDERFMYLQYMLMSKESMTKSVPYLIFKNSIGKEAPVMSLDKTWVGIWKDQVEPWLSMAGLSQFKNGLNIGFWQKFGNVRWYVPAYLYVAFGRLDATVAGKDAVKFDAESFLIDVGDRSEHKFDPDNEYLDHIVSIPKVLAPLFGWLYIRGPGFIDGVRSGVVTRLEDFQDTTSYNIVLGPENPSPGVPEPKPNLVGGKDTQAWWDALTEAMKAKIIASVENGTAPDWLKNFVKGVLDVEQD